ncbi:MAG TPA: DUF3306 domain-containing protein [Ramlibacter sp.]|nr:DUF3306 domain-containing protein [Ramlibacter sp.]
MADGFLGRWSRRKLDEQQGRQVAPEPAQSLAAAPAVVAQPVSPGAAPAEPDVPAPPPLTLEDVQALTPESDYAAFTARNVDPQVRNAAMKKLFSDPRYKVMDGMDVYIDDYSKPDPIPESMLRQLASAQFLKLFDDDNKEEPGATNKPADPTATAPALGDDADRPPAANVAQSGVSNGLPTDADPDLRLQQDHAPEGGSSGGGAG